MSQKDVYHHGDLHQALLDGALAWIADEGISSLSLRGLARRVGVSHNAPYRHFADKTALLAAVAEEGFLSLTLALNTTLAETVEHPLRRLESIGVSYVLYAVDHAAHYRVMFGPYMCDANLCKVNPYPSLNRAASDSFAVLVSVIAEGQIRGEIRGGKPQELARVAWSMVHGLAMLLIDGHLERSPQTLVETIAQQATRMLSEGLAKSDDA